MTIQPSLAARPSSPFLIALVAVGLAGGCADGTITSSSISGPAIIELSLPEGDRPTATADEPDPSPALLEPDNAAVMRQLATTLSRERTWLSPAVVEALARRAVDLDEVFADAPHLVSVDDRRYVIQLEALGRWSDFDPAADPFAVALSAEIAEPAGDDSVVASVAGQDRMVAEADLDHMPVIFVTLSTPPDGAASPAPALALGVAARTLRAATELPRDVSTRTAMATRRRAACTPIESSCDLGELTCPTGTDPFLVMTEILVNDKHEPWLRGAPEIEAFVVRADQAPTTGGAPGEASTTAMFDGAVHSDAGGRTRVLPDVNQIGTWYPISGGFALFPYALGDAWAVTGVEDDTEKGVWHARGETINWIALFETVLSAVSAYEELQYLELLQDLFTIFDMIRDAVDTDDMLQPAIGVARGLFEDEICDGAASWNTVFSLGEDSGDLAVRGHFACLPSSDICN